MAPTSAAATEAFRKRVFVGLGSTHAQALTAAEEQATNANFATYEQIAHLIVAKGVDFSEAAWASTDWRDTDWRDTEFAAEHLQLVAIYASP